MTPDIKRVLVAVDFSPNSTIALDYARALARPFGASLHLVHVCEVPNVSMASMDAHAVAYQGWAKQLADEAGRQLEAVRATVTDVPVTTEVPFGSPARAIVDAAANSAADLIVMGTHGHGAVMRLMIGSVAERVVRTAPCPVLTIRSTEPAQASTT